jgi:hypothetical protein
VQGAEARTHASATLCHRHREILLHHDLKRLLRGEHLVLLEQAFFEVVGQDGGMLALTRHNGRAPACWDIEV